MDVNNFKDLPIMGILRGLKLDQAQDLAESVISAGLKTIEIAMNTPSADKIIKLIATMAKDRLSVGAGTVLDMEDLYRALDSGATFIVMPAVASEVIEHCLKNNIPVFPGALTPQEIYDAWKMGATMVKVFPAKVFGPAYFKEIKGPFPSVELLACGGVNPSNIESYFSNGASGVAFGGSVFKHERLEAKDFSSIEKDIRALISAFGA